MCKSCAISRWIDDDMDKPECVRMWHWYFFFLYSSCWIISWVVSGVLASWSIILLHLSRRGRERPGVVMKAAAEDPGRLRKSILAAQYTSLLWVCQYRAMLSTECCCFGFHRWALANGQPLVADAVHCFYFNCVNADINSVFACHLIPV